MFKHFLTYCGFIKTFPNKFIKYTKYLFDQNKLLYFHLYDINTISTKNNILNIHTNILLTMRPYITMVIRVPLQSWYTCGNIKQADTIWSFSDAAPVTMWQKRQLNWKLTLSRNFQWCAPGPFVSVVTCNYPHISDTFASEFSGIIRT